MYGKNLEIFTLLEIQLLDLFAAILLYKNSLVVLQFFFFGSPEAKNDYEQAESKFGTTFHLLITFNISIDI